MKNTTPLRCAIYTRKSSEEGLDQSFNSLDAQREACFAFITSQASLGWKPLPDIYDDGGISGGTMERPGLQRMLQGIRDRKVDVVVVYKIDRLTRSLMDFSRIVDIFDGHNVSFVSVTQQFNTTTSMARLTLNVLLSFAQFEREVTAERIRDKIAASKKKGMWMGWRVPFGYEAIDRKLVVDPDRAEQVRRLFKRYLELRSVPALVDELNRAAPQPSISIESVDAGRGTTGWLYYLLANPIYIGKIRHKEVLSVGEHVAIVDDQTFQAAQKLLSAQAPRRNGTATAADTHLLTGLLCDENGKFLRPVHAQNHGKRYRYYVSADDKQSTGARPWRLPSSKIEQIVAGQLGVVLNDQARLALWLSQHRPLIEPPHFLEAASRFGKRYASVDDPSEKRKMLRYVFSRINVQQDIIRFEIDPRRLVASILNENATDAEQGLAPMKWITMDLPIQMKRRGIESRLVIQGADNRHVEHDPVLTAQIGRAHLYLEALTNGTCRSIDEASAHFRVHRADVSRILPLAFLSPKITDAILSGRQSADLTVAKLTRMLSLPLSWDEQHQMLDV